jgi:hypothetical protein
LDSDELDETRNRTRDLSGKQDRADKEPSHAPRAAGAPPFNAGLETLQRMFASGSTSNIPISSLALDESTLKSIMPFGINTARGGNLNVQDILGK